MALINICHERAASKHQDPNVGLSGLSYSGGFPTSFNGALPSFLSDIVNVETREKE